VTVPICLPPITTVAASPGFGPRLYVPETCVLPLDDKALKNTALGGVVISFLGKIRAVEARIGAAGPVKAQSLFV
jgi:hypothetical protein